MKSLAHYTDQELIHQYLAGNAESFTCLVNRHKNKIFTTIVLLVKDKYLAEDLFQDVFIRVVDTINKGKYKDEGKFLQWVLRIAHNICLDHFRKAKNLPVIHMGDNSDIFETLNFSEPAAEQSIMKQDDQHTIRNMIDKLPEEQRELIILRHYAHLSFKEIAHLTDCTINTALGRMRYALINLRRIMAEKQIVF